MRAFTAIELSRMQAAQESSMQDECRIGEYRSTADGYGNPSAEYVYGERVACGLELISPDEQQGTGEVPVIDARLRLAYDTSLDPRDRIEVISRYGTELDDALVFEIVGPPKRGPSGLVLDLRLVDDAATETGN